MAFVSVTDRLLNVTNFVALFIVPVKYDIYISVINTLMTQFKALF